MRTSVKLALGICALTFGWSAAANAEYFNRYQSGDWTNAEYDGGGCHYSYSMNRATGESHVNRDGNCANIVIGPGGQPMPAMPMAQVVEPLPPLH